jgi:hypothetical protein
VHSIYILKYVINSCGKILKENEVNKRSTDLKTANIYYQTYKDFSDESNYEVKDFINYNMIKLEKLLVGLKEKPIKKIGQFIFLFTVIIKCSFNIYCSFFWNDYTSFEQLNKHIRDLHKQFVKTCVSDPESTASEQTEKLRFYDLKHEVCSPPIKLWRRAVALVREKSLTKELTAKREFATLIEKLRALGYVGASTCDLANYDTCDLPDQPRIIFMGGGMASGKELINGLLSTTFFIQTSGKSSIAGKVTETDWWKKHNNCVVFINADRIKAVDPVFQALKEEVSEYASELVHSYSVKASEELFLTALKKRRHIIFDGTLSWAPYVSQTIEMLRDNKHIYKRGPGYLLNSNKNGTNFLKEKYWDIESACEKPLRPYCIDLIGVTSSVSIALTRGLVRRFVTGRGVPFYIFGSLIYFGF